MKILIIMDFLWFLIQAVTVIKYSYSFLSFLKFDFIHGYHILMFTNKYNVNENLGHFGKI